LRSVFFSWLMWIMPGLALAHPGLHEQVEGLNGRMKKQPSYQLYAQRAHLYYEGGQLDLALKDLDIASKLGPKEPLLFEYGNIYLAKGSAAKALKYFNQFIQFNDKLPEVYLSRARAFKQLGRSEEALRDLKHSLGLQASPPPGLFIEAANLVYSGKDSNLQPAIDLLDEGIQRMGVQGQLQERAIDLLMVHQNHSDALERMQRLGKERKHNVFWRFDYAQLLIKSGEKSDAQNELKVALREARGINATAVTDLRSKMEKQLSELK